VASLHVRLIGLILLVMVPAVGLLVYTGYEHRQQVRTLVEQDAHQMTQVITAYQEQWVTRSQ
jgi:Tfp pilus assembly major pilin PilA